MNPNMNTVPKLFLFDIDGTILSAHGVPKIVMHKVLSKRYDNLKYDMDYDFSGRTDPEIIEHLLTYSKIKFTSEDIKRILYDFAQQLDEEFKQNHRPSLLKGVKQLISELLRKEEAYLGLVTGNISEGARIKLESVGLDQCFPVGGFGDDSKHRPDLPPLAQKRAEDFYGTQFSNQYIWIIGDSIYDVQCAEANNMRCLAVSSGKTSREDLAAANPEFLAEDLCDTEAILRILMQKS